MNTGIMFPELERMRRDAMLAFAIGHLAISRKYHLATPIDFYEFMLLDPLVNEQVETSDVALASAGIRQYIHAIYGGMEPGYDGVFLPDRYHEWRDRRVEYALWAGYQMLANYPENYVEPPLRINQTRAFRDFVSNLNQGRMTKDSVQTALQQYLSSFEDTANLKVIAGYCTSHQFNKADYWFLGRQASSPARYCCRRLRVDVPDKSSSIPPTAWGEWEPVQLAVADEQVKAIRPVWFNERLHLAFLQITAASGIDAGQPPGERWALCLCYVTLTGEWSPPRTLLEGAVTDRMAGMREFQLVAAALDASAGTHRLLLGMGEPEDDEPLACVLLDELLNDAYAGSEDRPADAIYKRYVAKEASVQIPLNVTGELVFVVTNSYYGPSQSQHCTVDTTVRVEEGVANITFYGTATTGFQDDTKEATFEGPGGVYETMSGSDWTFRFQGTVAVGELVAGTTYDFKLSLRTQRADTSVTHRIAVEHQATVTEWPSVEQLPDGGQFLNVSCLTSTVSHIRLNTLFGPYLVNRAAFSTQAVLDWSVQEHREGNVPEEAWGVSDKVDFKGANGRYFWELFFHIPHHVAWRFMQDGAHALAEEWFHCIFNPLAKERDASHNPHAYWNTRPLLEPGDAAYEVEGAVDPDAICYAEPVHYRKAIFVGYVKNLIAWGDQSYRRLTRDSLNQARLLYVRALSLMGPRPDSRMIGRWTATTLGSLQAYNATTFLAFESDPSLVSLQTAASVAAPMPTLDLLDATCFRFPLNTDLLSVWEQIDLRLEYLRQNLTLDGQPLTIPLYDAPASPRDLLLAQSGAAGAGQRGTGGLAVIPPYRFRAMLPRAQGAVETLCRFGDTVLGLRERKDRAHLEELVQTQVQEMGAFSEELETKAVEQAGLNLLALGKSMESAIARHTYFSELWNEDTSHLEDDASSSYEKSARERAASGASLTLGGELNCLAFLAGTAYGFTMPGAAFEAAGLVTQVFAELEREKADGKMRLDGFQRRRKEWGFQRDQAALELNALVAQQALLEKAQAMAVKHQQMTRKARQQADAHYTFLKSRSAKAYTSGCSARHPRIISRHTMLSYHCAWPPRPRGSTRPAITPRASSSPAAGSTPTMASWRAKP